MTLVRRPVMLLAPAALLVVALALATNVLPLRQIVAQRQEIGETQATLDALMAANASLDSQVAALDAPIEVERIAREDLGYVRPGETAFVVIDPTSTEEPRAGATTAGATSAGSASAGADSAVPAREGGFLSRVWDFVTGRDLAAGG